MFGMDTPFVFFLFLFPAWFLVPAVAGAVIAGRRGRSRTLWFALCAALPLLLLVPLFLPPARPVPGRWQRCPACREMVRHGATVCRHCQNALAPPAEAGRGGWHLPEGPPAGAQPDGRVYLRKYQTTE
jgi:hypothetical protein